MNGHGDFKHILLERTRMTKCNDKILDTKKNSSTSNEHENGLHILNGKFACLFESLRSPSLHCPLEREKTRRTLIFNSYQRRLRIHAT